MEVEWKDVTPDSDKMLELSLCLLMYLSLCLLMYISLCLLINNNDIQNTWTCNSALALTMSKYSPVNELYTESYIGVQTFLILYSQPVMQI